MGREKTRQKLLDAAREAFAAKGYHDAKIEDIARAAKVGKGTFYLYFSDKRAVFVELVDSLFLRLRSSILRVDVHADIESQVRHNIRAVIAVFLDEPALTRILLSYAEGLDPAFLKRIRAFYADVRAYLEKSLREGQRLNVVAKGDAHLFALFTMGAIRETLLDSALSGVTRPREELVEGMFSLLQSGFLRVDTSRRKREA